MSGSINGYIVNKSAGQPYTLHGHQVYSGSTIWQHVQSVLVGSTNDGYLASITFGQDK